jgi:transposase InsO family protein
LRTPRRQIFETLLEAQILAEDFRIDYNTYRPHSSIGYLAPAKFAEQWHVREAGLSELVDS